MMIPNISIQDILDLNIRGGQVGLQVFFSEKTIFIYSQCRKEIKRRWMTKSSVLISRMLDHLGYGLPMVRLRQQTFDYYNYVEAKYYTYLAGSKAEGLTKPYESDYDSVSVPMNIICTENPQHYVSRENISIFKLDMAYTAPGYTRLILEKLGNSIHCVLHESLTEPISGNVYVFSDIWREKWREFVQTNGNLIFSQQSQGPSNPGHDTNGCDGDIVIGIICDCPDLLQSWIDRPRKYNWPNEDVVREISTMEAHAVPVGCKGSQFQFIEWRICFTKAEIKLIRSFNDCQVKLLVLLKWIAKSYLKPRCKEMTSYVMKNLVMWMAEKLPAHYFIEQNLINSLNISLRALKHCLLRKCLPSYMIADRNLFADRLTDRERSRLCLRIDLLLREGPQAVIKCGKLRNAFNMLLRSPETFFSFTQRKLQYNILVLLCEYAYAQGWHQLVYILAYRMRRIYTTHWDLYKKMLS